jgi:hypothetical protein
MDARGQTQENKDDQTIGRVQKRELGGDIIEKNPHMGDMHLYEQDQLHSDCDEFKDPEEN